MSEKRKYDSTIARMAGNIAGGLFAAQPQVKDKADAEKCLREVVLTSVSIARAIVAEVVRTEPEPTP
jgi:hypothetical protein